MSRAKLRAFLRNMFYSVGAQFISLLLGICAAVVYPKYLNVGLMEHSRFGLSRYGVEKAWGIEAFGKISLALALSNLALRRLDAVSLAMFPALRNVRPERLPDV